MSQEKPRILFIVHCYNNRGGVEEHTKTLESALLPYFDTYVAYPENGKVYLRKNNEPLLELPGEAVPWPMCPYNIAILEESLAKVLEASKPNLIHIQHFLHWHLGLLDQLTAQGVPTLLTFHEYFAVTPHFTMQFVEHPLQCYSAEYAKKVFGDDISEYLQQRRDALITSFSKMSALIVPSKFLSLELSKAFPWEYRIIEHGIEPFEFTKKAHSPLRFGYMGSLIQQKGWQIALKAFSLLREKNSNCELHVFGSGAEPPSPALDGVIFHGRYSREDIGRIVSEFDIGIIPSTFKETFCYVLSEMQQAQKPVIVSRLGALGERVKDGQTGLRFTAGSPLELAAAMLWFLDYEDWKTWNIPPPRSLDQMILEYKQLYLELIEQS